MRRLMVDPLDFEAPSALNPLTHYVIAVIYGVLALSAFILNSLVILTILMDRSLLTGPNLFIISIAIADWLMAVVANPLGVVANVTQAWPFGRDSCVYYAWVTTFLGLSTMLHHSALAVERCRAVTRPFKGQSSQKRNLLVICLLWSYTLMWSLFPLFGWSAYGPEGANTVCSIRWHSPSLVDTSFIICIFILFFFGPVLVIITCHVMTFWNVRHMVKKARTTWGTNAAPTLETMSKAVCLAKIALLMVTGFFIAWTPYAIVSMYSGFFKAKNIPALATAIPAMFAKSASLYNPLIYFFLYKKFRASLKRLLQRIRGQNVLSRQGSALSTQRVRV